MGIQNLHDVTTKEVANAAGIYYGGAMIGPLLFGILMDKVKSPIMIVTLANIVVVIGAACQAFAPSIGVCNLCQLEGSVVKLSMNSSGYIRRTFRFDYLAWANALASALVAAGCTESALLIMLLLQVMYLARAILGFAGESTPFGTVESLQRLFPDQFLLMAGAS